METAPLDISFYKQALIVLGAAGVVIPLFHRLHVSPVLGFMLVGIAVGPSGFGSLTIDLPWLAAITISAPASIEPIAHLGVVLLLFMIGLELSFERLWVMRRLVFGLGSLQVVLCAAVLGGVAILLGHNRISAGVIGLALAMSSTAVVIQVLSEEKRLNTVTGPHQFRGLAVSGPGGSADCARSRNIRPNDPRQQCGRIRRRCWPGAAGCRSDRSFGPFRSPLKSPVTITSTLELTSSAANAGKLWAANEGNLSKLLSLQRYSIGTRPRA